MSFDDILSEDAANFVDEDAFPGVESVTIHRPGLADVTTDANVFRGVPVRDAMGRPTLEFRMFVRNDATTSVTAIDAQAYTVSVARDFGGTPEAITITQIIEQDAGGWLLKLE